MIELDHRWVGAILCILLFILCGIMLYVAYFKLDEMESHLQNCPVVMDNKAAWNGMGPSDRTNRVTHISMIFDSSKLWHNTDKVDMDEIRNFPVPLKRWLLYPFYLANVLFPAMGIYYVWVTWFLPD